MRFGCSAPEDHLHSMTNWRKDDAVGNLHVRIERLHRICLVLGIIVLAAVVGVAAQDAKVEADAEGQDIPEWQKPRDPDPMKADYVTNFLDGMDRPAGRSYVRPKPEPAELLALKEKEGRLREELDAKGIEQGAHVRTQKELVACLEAAGEDPLPAFRNLCEMVAATEEMGPKTAWELASENIGRFYDGRFYDECERYCRMVQDSKWADKEARAWVLLRVLCCERMRNKTGVVRQLARELMTAYPETEAARVHTAAAVEWHVVHLEDRMALELLDRMMKLHADKPGFVAQSLLCAAEICDRTGWSKEGLAYVGRLEALAAGKDLEPETDRNHYRSRAALLRARLARRAEEQKGELR